MRNIANDLRDFHRVELADYDANYASVHPFCLTSFYDQRGAKMRKLSGLVVASLLGVTTAHGEPFSTMGVGALTCAQFLEHYRSDPAIEDRFFDWAQGFMSGLNDALEETVGKYRDLKSIPTAQQKQILRAFCSNDAAAGYRDGINFLLNRLTVVPSTLKGAK